MYYFFYGWNFVGVQLGKQCFFYCYRGKFTGLFFVFSSSYSKGLFIEFYIVRVIWDYRGNYQVWEGYRLDLNSLDQFGFFIRNVVYYVVRLVISSFYFEI